MNQSKRINTYAWLLLLILFYPMSIKEVHHHTGDNQQDFTHSAKGFELNRYSDDRCDICAFEFVQFMPNEAVGFPKAPFRLSKLVLLSVEFPIHYSGSFFRNRAPPTC
jgi:hypothetical protein